MPTHTIGILKTALAHLHAGRLVEAERLYRGVLARDAMNAVATHFLGVALLKSGRTREGLEHLQRSLEADPDNADFLSNYSDAVRLAGSHAQAMQLCRRALAIRPDHPDALNNLGAALIDAGQPMEAIEPLRKAAAARPRSLPTALNLARALTEAGHPEEAPAVLRRAIQIAPGHLPTLSGACMGLCRLGRFREAQEIAEGAVRAQDDQAGPHSVLGMVFTKQGRHADAAACFERATRVSPDQAQSWVDLGNAHHALSNPAGMRDCYQRAVTLAPENAVVHLGLGELLLSLGDFEGGFREFEWRWRAGDPLLLIPEFRQPRWEGESLAGKTILLHSEQGFGDAIQFARYVPLVAAGAARVVVDCYPDIAELFRSLEGAAEIVPRGETLPGFDLHCPLLSLPRYFGTTPKTIPVNVPYLRAPAASSRQWKHELERRSGLRIGLVWEAGAVTAGREYRSIALAAFAPLASLPGISWYSLQKGPAAAQAAAPGSGLPIADLSARLDNFAATAAVIENLDLVISVDTATAHLAGALAKPVWTLLAHMRDWRWNLDETACPWYPTMRLFRQRTAGAWSGVIEDVRTAIAERLAAPLTRPAGPAGKAGS